MLHERGTVTESYYYLFHITNLVYYYYQKTIVLDVFRAVSCHLNFTFSRGIMPPDSCSPLPQVAQSAHALQDLYLISLFISKELLKICRLFNSCILRWKKLNEENNGPSAQSVSIMFVQEAFSNYYFCRGTQIQTNCTLTPHTSDHSNDHSNVMGRKNIHYILLNHFWRKENYSILKNEKQNFVSPFSDLSSYSFS